MTHQARITLKKETIRPRFLVQGSWVTLPDSDRFLAGCEPSSVVDAKKVLLLVPILLLLAASCLGLLVTRPYRLYWLT